MFLGILATGFRRRTIFMQLSLRLLEKSTIGYHVNENYPQLEIPIAARRDIRGTKSIITTSVINIKRSHSFQDSVTIRSNTYVTDYTIKFLERFSRKRSFPFSPIDVNFTPSVPPYRLSTFWRRCYSVDLHRIVSVIQHSVLTNFQNLYRVAQKVCHYQVSSLNRIKNSH